MDAAPPPKIATPDASAPRSARSPASSLACRSARRSVWRSAWGSARLSGWGATGLIALAAVLFGLQPLFAKALQAEGLIAAAIVFHRLALSAVVLAPQLDLSPGGRRATAWSLLSGSVIALGWLGYVEALAVAPVATVGVIYLTYPFLTVLLAWLWLGARPTARALIAGAMVVSAGAVALGPSAGGLGPVALLKLFAAPLAFATAILILSAKLGAITAAARTGGVSLGAAVTLSPLLIGADAAAVLPSTAQGWLLIAGTAVLTALIPNLLFAFAAPAAGPTRTAMTGGLELPTMFVVGWTAFGEAIGPFQALAGALILGAIALSPAGPSVTAPRTRRAERLRRGSP